MTREEKIILSFFVPATALFLFGITASYSDSRGVLEYLNIVFPGYEFYCRVLFVCFLFLAVYKYAALKRSKMKGALRAMCDWSLLLMVLIILSFIANEHGLLRGIQDLYFNPVSYLFLFLVFNEEKGGTFLWYVCVQILIATAVITLPLLEILDARQAIAAGGAYVGGDAYGGIGLMDLESVDKIDIGQYAQFQNPNTLGFYSGIAIAVGITKLATANISLGSRLIYAIISISGLFCWLASLTRAPILALFFTSAVAFLYARNKVIIGILASLVLTGISLTESGLKVLEGLASYLIPSSDNISVVSRFAGFDEGLAAIANSPIWGVTNNWDWDRGVPHMLPLYYSSFYGVPAGTVALWVFYFIPLIGFFRIWKSGKFRDALPYAQVYGVLAAISFTNNAPGTCLFAFGIAYVQINIQAILSQGISQSGTGTDTSYRAIKGPSLGL